MLATANQRNLSSSESNVCYFLDSTLHRLPGKMKEETMRIWIADDGSIFRTAIECIAHETHCMEIAETESRLLSKSLSSRVSNLFEESTATPVGLVPPELLESFDHCSFSDEFRAFASKLNLNARFLVEHLDSFARLGGLANEIYRAVGRSLDEQQILRDLSLLPNLDINGVLLHIKSLAELGHILRNLNSEKEEITAYYWKWVDEAYSDHGEHGDTGETVCDLDEKTAWEEEMESRDPFEGSPC